MKRVFLISMSPLKLQTMGTLFIGTVLKKEGHTIKLHGIDLSNKNWLSQLIMEVETFKPEIVGVSVVTMFFAESLKIIKSVKNIDPAIVTVFGGPHPSIMPEDVFRSANELDFCVIGEGEVTIVELVDAISNGREDYRSIKGIAFRDNLGKIVVTPRRDVISDLDTLPIIDRALLPRNCVTGVAGYPLGSPSIRISVSRGCPFQCSFCQPTSELMFGKKIRMRSPENVMKEVFYLKEQYDVGGLIIMDDTVFLNRVWLNSFLDSLIEADLGILWMGNGRFSNLASDELFKKIKRSGCVYLVMTFESWSERVRNQVLAKNIKQEDIDRIIQMLKRNDIPYQSNFMLNSPTETISELYETFRKIVEIEPNYMNFSFTTPLPGTYLYDKYKKSYTYIENNDFHTYDIGAYKAPENNPERERLSKIVMDYLAYRYSATSPLSRFRNFWRSRYVRKTLLIRWKTLVLKKNMNLKHFVYDIFAICYGGLIYLKIIIFGDSKKKQIESLFLKLLAKEG